MNRIGVLAGGSVFALAVVSAQAAPGLSPEQRQAFRVARSVRVISDVSQEEGLFGFRSSTAPGAFKQPFEEVTRAVLEPSGVALAQGEAGDLTFRVQATLTPTMNAFSAGFSPGGEVTGVRMGGLGAHWAGTLTVSAPSVPDYQVSFEGQAPSPQQQSRAELDPRTDGTEIQLHVARAAAEALLAFGSYAHAVTEAMGQIHGRELLLVVLNETARTNRFRAAAARALGGVGGEGVFERLLEALKDSPEVRAGAAAALGRLGDPRGVQPLIPLLGEQGADLRQAVAESLGKLGDSTCVEPLIAALADKEQGVRRAAAGALAQLSGHNLGKDTTKWDELLLSLFEAISTRFGPNPLVAALKNAELRPQAIKVLKGMKDAPLIAALKSGDVTTRSAAASALGDLKDPGAVDPLIAALKDESEGVRSSAAKALAAIRDGRTVGPLIVALGDQGRDVRAAAARALGGLGDAQAVEPLIAALKDQDPIAQAAAATALGEIKDPRAIEPLVQTLKDPGAGLAFRNAVANAIEKSRNPLAVELLSAALNDQDKDTRALVARTLGSLGDVRAVQPLIGALKDTHPEVRSQASAALTRITNQSFGTNQGKWQKWWEKNKGKPGRAR